VYFGTSSAFFHFNMSVNGQTVQTPGTPGVAGEGLAIMLNGAKLSSNGSESINGPSCSQQLRVEGFLAGNAAVRAGMAYHLSTSGGANGDVYGAAAYARGAVTAGSPPLPP
jgi:hypothetical protein